MITSQVLYFSGYNLTSRQINNSFWSAAGPLSQTVASSCWLSVLWQAYFPYVCMPGVNGWRRWVVFVCVCVCQTALNYLPLESAFLFWLNLSLDSNHFCHCDTRSLMPLILRVCVCVCVGGVSKENGDEPLTSWAPGQDQTIQLWCTQTVQQRGLAHPVPAIGI